MNKKIQDHWDELIANAPNGLPYAYSWYLDIVTSNRWRGLFDEETGTAMPIPYGSLFFSFRQMLKLRGWSAHRVVQPVFCQQLGLFGKRFSDMELFHDYFKDFMSRVRYVDSYCLNETNRDLPLAVALHRMKIRERSNYVLPLRKTYKGLVKGYSKSHRRALEKSKDLIFEEDVLPPADFLGQHRKYVGRRAGLSMRAYIRWELLIRAVRERNMGKLISMRTPAGEVASAAFILQSHGRLIYQGGYAVAEKKDLNPMHALLDALIRRHAGSRLLLDFEGSDIPSIAEFFRRFGAQERKYWMVYK